MSRDDATMARLNLVGAASDAKNTPVAGGRRLDGDSYARAQATAEHAEEWMVALGAFDYTNRIITLYLDGEQDKQTTGAWSGGGNTSNTSSSAVAKIGSNNVENVFLNGKIAELIIGIGLPDTDEIDQLFGYTHHRWGLQSKLPALHPYKSEPPYA